MPFCLLLPKNSSRKKALHLPFLYNGSQRMAIAFNIGQEGFRRTKVQVHIQTYRQVVTVVCNIEGNDFFFLLFFSHIFYEREYQTTIRYPVFSLIILLPAINQSLFFHCPSGSHGEKNLLPGLVLCRVIRTGLQEDTQHIVHTHRHLVMMLVGITAQGALLVDDTLSVLIAEFHLIYRVTFSFLCSLSAANCYVNLANQLR